MADNDPTVIINAPSVWAIVKMFLHMVSIALLVWCCVQLWLMNQFMISFAVGTARMSITDYMIGDRDDELFEKSNTKPTLTKKSRK